VWAGLSIQHNDPIKFNRGEMFNCGDQHLVRNCPALYCNHCKGSWNSRNDYGYHHFSKCYSQPNQRRIVRPKFHQQQKQQQQHQPVLPRFQRQSMNLPPQSVQRGNQDAGMRPTSKKRNFQGAINQIEGEEVREDNFRAIAEFNDDQWDDYAEGLVVQSGSSVDHSEEQFDYYESSQFMIVTSKDKSESLPLNAESTKSSLILELI
jgi:hypothetical protein